MNDNGTQRYLPKVEFNRIQSGCQSEVLNKIQVVETNTIKTWYIPTGG